MMGARFRLPETGVTDRVGRLPAMLFTASTIKDSPENVRFFVAANLASGVDHMFVFLDAPREREQKEVAALLDDHPHVTCIPTTKRTWWAGERPGGLNVRQRINANWTRALLKPFPWAEWLFHIDGDEVACVDREALDDVPAGLDAIRLVPWEAVSQWTQPERPTRFKRLLEDGELNLLHVLGAIPDPSNQTYFHGHVMGKSGVRPASELALTLHEAVSAYGEPQPCHEDPRLRVLHYDAPSGEEFVRKWTALATAGPARYRASRAPSARALRTLVSSDLPEETRAKYLRRIYDVTTRDDVELLDELGLLVQHDPERSGTTPRPFPEGAAEELASRVAEFSAAPKTAFFVDDAASQAGHRGRNDRLKRLVRRS
jgi:hypothetical protein